MFLNYFHELSLLKLLKLNPLPIKNLESRICEKDEEKVVDGRVWVLDLRWRCGGGVTKVEDMAVASEVALSLSGFDEAV